jgi:carboxyl-terminal processing protease
MRKQYLFVIIAFITGCNPNKQDEVFNGIWKSLGYGKILVIKDNTYSFYDITNISCLPARNSTLDELEKSIELRNDTLLLLQGTLNYSFTRLNSLPDACNKKLSDIAKSDIQFNFEVFAKTIKENFAYFELNKINWDSLYLVQKGKLNSNSTDTDLYIVLDEILRLIKDNHGQVEPTEDVYEKSMLINSKKESSKKLKEYGDFEIAQIVSGNFLEKDLTTDSKLVQWGMMNEKIGYIQINAMWLYADLKLLDSLIAKDGWVATYATEMTRLNESEYIDLEIEGISRVMDKVMNDLSQTDYIIMDVRFNGGGQDAVSLEILKRFNEKKTKIATQKAKLGAGFTPEQSIYLEPHDNAYTKPVFVLTSRQSASATDLLALATLSLNHVKRIGSRTNGAISTALEKRLPNDWYFSISNEIYLDNNGVCYENTGVPVNYEMNYPEDRQTFFRWVAENVTLDKQNILRIVNEFEKETK